MFKIPRDPRERIWTFIDNKIQESAKHKDKNFVLKGKWKKFVCKEDGYKVFSVDEKWVQNNLCVYFAHGGHGLVHEFIPLDEIWIASHHFNKDKHTFFRCNCKIKTKEQIVSPDFFESSMIHEITECEDMKKGDHYWKSHNLALKQEKDIGLIRDPFNDLPRAKHKKTAHQK